MDTVGLRCKRDIEPVVYENARADSRARGFPDGGSRAGRQHFVGRLFGKSSFIPARMRDEAHGLARKQGAFFSGQVLLADLDAVDASRRGNAYLLQENFVCLDRLHRSETPAV